MSKTPRTRNARAYSKRRHDLPSDDTVHGLSAVDLTAIEARACPATGRNLLHIRKVKTRTLYGASKETHPGTILGQHSIQRVSVLYSKPTRRS